MGIGDAAGVRAGQQFAQGHLYYVFLKPEFATPGRYPDLKPVSPPPRGLTPGTPAQGSRPPAEPSRSNTGGGSDEMFPVAVKTH